MAFSSDHICCYEIPNAEDMRVREGDRKRSGGGGTVFIRCLPIVLSTAIHRGYKLVPGGMSVGRVCREETYSVHAEMRINI